MLFCSSSLDAKSTRPWQERQRVTNVTRRKNSVCIFPSSFPSVFRGSLDTSCSFSPSLLLLTFSSFSLPSRNRCKVSSSFSSTVWIRRLLLSGPVCLVLACRSASSWNRTWQQQGSGSNSSRSSSSPLRTVLFCVCFHVFVLYVICISKPFCLRTLLSVDGKTLFPIACVCCSLLQQ